MSKLLKQLTSEIEKNREEFNPVKKAWIDSCNKIGLSNEDPFVQFGLKFTDHPDLIYSDNKYHNHMHSADAIISAAFLVKEEFTGEDLKNNGSLLLFSMMCHDLQHNGKNNEFDYQLEKEAVLSMRSHAEKQPEILNFWNNNLEKKYGTWDAFAEKVENIILGTDFKNGPTTNLKNYEESPLDLNKLKLLANEADILPSCTSKLGPKLGMVLSEELNNPGVGSWKGREFFMSNLAKFGSVASKKLGIQKHIDAQLEAIRAFGATNLDEESSNGNFLKIADNIHQKVNFDLEKALENVFHTPLDEFRDKYLNNDQNNQYKNKI